MQTEPTLVGTLEFESPINMERTGGLTPVADKAKSVMELYHYTDDCSAFIEWEVEELGLSEHIGLKFKVDWSGKRTLTDYDGVFTLPDQAMDLLEKHGVDCAEMRRDLSDDD